MFFTNSQSVSKGQRFSQLSDGHTNMQPSNACIAVKNMFCNSRPDWTQQQQQQPQEQLVQKQHNSNDVFHLTFPLYWPLPSNITIKRCFWLADIHNTTLSVWLLNYFFLFDIKGEKSAHSPNRDTKTPTYSWYAHTVCVNRYWLKQLRPAEAWIWPLWFPVVSA